MNVDVVVSRQRYQFGFIYTGVLCSNVPENARSPQSHLVYLDHRT